MPRAQKIVATMILIVLIGSLQIKVPVLAKDIPELPVQDHVDVADTCHANSTLAEYQQICSVLDFWLEYGVLKAEVILLNKTISLTDLGKAKFPTIPVFTYGR